MRHIGKSSKGFSLVEILISIGVITSMSVGAFIIYKNYKEQSLLTQSYNDVMTFHSMIENEAMIVDDSNRYAAGRRSVCFKIQKRPEEFSNFKMNGSTCSFIHKNTLSDWSITDISGDNQTAAISISWAKDKKGGSYAPFSIPAFIMKLENMPDLKIIEQSNKVLIQFKNSEK